MKSANTTVSTISTLLKIPENQTSGAWLWQLVSKGAMEGNQNSSKVSLEFSLFTAYSGAKNNGKHGNDCCYRFTEINWSEAIVPSQIS